ncbi:mechanosensitive ion channel family protein [Legionella impletisoli]|uniref:Portal protein n=1 Tax=Legionella impletisoli TaxID=343510 RepID=A0A917JNU2_9GAMM|nr:mechanosensitive ion channel domain-containing protein [Legionella impletisoli]GGI79341.1 portal protein [Legionella impletisoli]
MGQRIGFFIAGLIYLFFSLPLFAAVNHGEAVDPEFNIVRANEQFDKLSIKLSTENLDPNTLNEAIEALNILAKQAETCVQKTDARIRELDAQIKQFFGEDEKTPGRVDSNYLENQRAEVAEKQAKCRLFLIRANEALDAYRTTFLSLQQAITFTRSETIITRLQAFPNDWDKLRMPKMDAAKVDSLIDFLPYALPLFLLALFVSWRIQKLMHRKWQKQMSIFLSNTVLLCLGFFLLGLLILTPTLFVNAEDNELFHSMVVGFLAYVFLFFIYKFLFTLRRLPILLQWYGFDVVFLRRLGLAIILIYFAHAIGLDLLQLFDASENLNQLFEEFMLLVSLSAMIYFTLILYHSHSAWFKNHFSGSLLYKLIGFIVVLLLVLDFIGYSILAINAAYMLFSLLLVSALGTVLFLGISNAYALLSYNPHYLFYLKKFFGYSKEPPFIELLLLKIIAQIIVLVGMAALLAQLIGEASFFIDYFFEYLIEGFQVGNMTIIPWQWLLGVLIFCLLSLGSRHVANKISKSQQLTEEEEEEKQVAIASIILYAGFAISFIVGLLLAGFSFTSLAIIAGALSVGIGLGMQSIVNNFFSGLILLIEKPIKAGDRIKIDDIEGFVKRVSVRSTQIVTPAQEDIIIPNSDLITHQVVNYMFSDKYWRVKCVLGVAYGSDTDKVSNVMMDVALAHPEVIKKAPNKPMVLFRSFGESALNFELWCLIKDVNQKYRVTSDLNFALDKACREQGIIIAFPQRDVHIKFDEKNLPWNNSEGS